MFSQNLIPRKELELVYSGLREYQGSVRTPYVKWRTSSLEPYLRFQMTLDLFLRQCGFKVHANAQMPEKSNMCTGVF